METKIVTPPERTVAVPHSRELEVPAVQDGDSAAKLETAGSIYLSPVVRIDTETQTAVLQYRDPTTGKVLRQFPPKAGSDAYAETEKRTHAAESKPVEVTTTDAQQQPAPKSSSAPSSSNAGDTDTHQSVVA
jgi:hypothetical protein